MVAMSDQDANAMMSGARETDPIEYALLVGNFDTREQSEIRDRGLAALEKLRAVESDLESALGFLLEASEPFVKQGPAWHRAAELLGRGRPETWDPRKAGPLLRKSREMEKGRIHG